MRKNMKKLSSDKKTVNQILKKNIKQNIKFIKNIAENIYKKILTKEIKAVKVVNVMKDNRGMGTVEIILIIVVLIGLVIIFKTQITSVVQDIFSKITTKTGAI
jgi:hypothetical protein